MGFSQSKFLSLPKAAQAKKCADLIRVILMRLGEDWTKAVAEYNQMVKWIILDQNTSPHQHSPTDLSIQRQQLQHHQLVDLYQYWRTEAGLGLEKDVYLQPDPGDREQATAPSIAWEILIHNMRSAYNAGSVIRTADCFGFSKVHYSGYTAHAHNTTLRSAARGAEQWIPYKQWSSPLDCIYSVLNQGISVIALELTADASAIDDFNWSSQGLLLLGNEELGVPPELLQLCTAKVYIPMYGRKASLNVASALAITAHSIRRKTHEMV